MAVCQTAMFAALVGLAGIAVFLSELGRFISMPLPAWMAVATWLVG